MTVEPATGIITFLFTDLVSSTELLDRLGDDAAEILHRTHFRLLRGAVAVHGGQEVKSLGDGLMVVFPSAIDALTSAIAMQQGVHGHNQREPETPLNVRIGLHVGEPIRDEEDYFGTPVVIAKRLCDSAEGGQIIASQLVRSLIGSRGSFAFADLGPRTLKGLSEPVAACEVLWEPAVEELSPALPLPASLLGGEKTPFVGREAGLSTLFDAWGKAKSGQRQLVLLSGEPGIGKTRLAAEFAQAAHAEGARVLLGRCDEELALPYMPFVEALRQYFASRPSGASESPAVPWGEDLARLIPEARRAGPAEPAALGLGPEEERFRLYDAVDCALTEIARGESLVLLLDDLHWADKASLLLLRHLLRSPVPAPILFLGTYRETDLARTHPLAEMLGDFRREPSFLHVHLGGLSSDDTAALIDAWAGHETAGNFAEAVHAATEGNPFFIQEVLRHLTETGVFVRHDGGWTTPAAIEDMGIPEGVREVVGRRLSHLPEDANAALSAASCFGRDFELGPLEGVTGLLADRLLLALEEALAAGLIGEAGAAGGYRFSHALVQEVLYTELSSARRTRLHGRIAEALEAGYGRKAADNAARLAKHYLEAGTLSRANARKAAYYSRLAAEQAEAQTAWDEAARHYQDCLTIVSEAGEDPQAGSEQVPGQDEAALLLAMGRCLRYAADLRGAWRSFMRALTIYRERGDGAGMARATLEASEIRAPVERLAALAEEALSVLDAPDDVLRARLLLMRASDEFDDASCAAAAEAEKIAQTLDRPDLLGRLAARDAWEALRGKRTAEALSLARRAHDLFDKGAEHRIAAETLWNMADWTLWDGKLDEGTAKAEDALAYARKFHVRLEEQRSLASLLAVAVIRCEFEQFESILNEVPGEMFWFPMLSAARAEMSGDTDGAARLAPGPDAGGVPQGSLPQVLGTLARTSYNAGHEQKAKDFLGEWARELSKIPLTRSGNGFRFSALAAMDECLPALGDGALIRPLYEELIGYDVFRYAPNDARGLDRIAGALALRLEKVDEAGELFQAGLAWAVRERCPVEQGRCLQGLAEVAARRRRRGEGLRLLDEASVLFEAHGAKLYLDRANAARDALIASAHGPIRPLPPAHPGGLSGREVEVLRLIAQGKSNQQIADALVISVNTVIRHVSNIFAKTGAANRTEVGAYAHAQGLIAPR